MIIVPVLVRNEANRNLDLFLKTTSIFADKIIILDDCSDDNTIDICKEYKKVEIFESPFSIPMFSIDESKLRSHLWDRVRLIAKEGDWIFSLDADEIVSKNFINLKDKIIEDCNKNKYDWITFHLCDMWNEKQYRVDGYWSPLFRRFFRFKDLEYGKNAKLHVGSLPKYADESKNGTSYSNVKIKHLSYIKDEDKEKKYNFYIKNTFGFNFLHALTIKDKNPRLVEYCDTYESYNKEPNVLICSLIKNREWCLNNFIDGIKKIEYDLKKISFLFILNNSIDNSKEILKQFKKEMENKCKNFKILELTYKDDNKEHSWTERKIAFMAHMRNMCLQRTLNFDGEENIEKEDNDYCFMLDSDIIIKDGKILRHLINLDKEIISEVFWAKWNNAKDKNVISLPNVWINGGYFITNKFLDTLLIKGVYKVGGLGAITLINKSAIKKGFNYTRVEFLPREIMGEDRDACCRASVLGIELWADTYFTPKHLDGPDDLKK